MSSASEACAGQKRHGPRAAAPRPPLTAQAHGVLVLNKPSGPSSAQHIAQARRLFGQKKIGHAGTLDPMASGVLLVLLGQATKLSGALMGGKIYSGLIKLGEETDTWDALGTVTATAATAHLTPAQVEDALAAWVGVHEQEVPAFSAAKHEGVPLYRLARAGQATPRKTKPVQIEFVRMLACELPFVRFRVGCGSGTYIRSLAHSLGTRLGCGAVLCELTREYSHPFALSDAHDLDELARAGTDLASCLVPIARALADHAQVTVPPHLEARVRNGVALPWAALSCADRHGRPLAPLAGQPGLLLTAGGQPLGLAVAAVREGAGVWQLTRGLWMEP